MEEQMKGAALPAVSSLGDACCGCGACAAACPKKCVTMEPDAWGFPRPSVDVFSQA